MKPKQLALLLLICTLAACVAEARDFRTVRVSILGVVRPAEARITLRGTPASLQLQAEGNSSRHVLGPEHETLFAAVAGRLRIANGEELLETQKARIECRTDPCRFLLRVTGAPVREYAGSTLELRAVDRTIVIVLLMPLEDLVASIVMSEMRESRQPEALKAFAVVARAFAIAGARHPELEADLCDTTHCQVFQAFPANDAVQSAVLQTRGIVLTYRRRPFHPYYSRSCGGQTSTYKEVWGKQSPDYPFPSVACVCATRSVQWKTLITRAEFSGNSALQPDSDSPEQFRIAAGRAFGWDRIRSNQFTAKALANGDWLISGRGIGHGVGLCQTGALMLA